MNIKRETLRHILLATGVGALLASILLFFQQQATLGFTLAFAGFSFIQNAEMDVDLTEKLDRKYFREAFKRRTYISTLGLMCSILSWFCLALAGICWLILR